MMQPTCFRFSFRRAAALALLIILLCGSAALSSAFAQSAPFAGFAGEWSGVGKIHVKSKETDRAERIRCSATYRPRGGHDIDLTLACKSDSYHFDLTGQFTADNANRISGQWTEHTRNAGGIGIGYAQGDRLQLHVESSAFAATLVMYTRGRTQAISLDSHGLGQTVTASITLRRR